MYGSYYNPQNYNALYIKQLPCATRVMLYDGSEVGAEEDCVWDQQQMEQYLGGASFLLHLYFNQQKFKPDVYGEDRIKRFSSRSTAVIVADRSSWTERYV